MPTGIVLNVGILLAVLLGTISWCGVRRYYCGEKKYGVRMALGEDDDQQAPAGSENPSRIKVLLARAKRLLTCGWGDLTSIEEDRIRLKLEAKERERRR